MISESEMKVLLLGSAPNAIIDKVASELAVKTPGCESLYAAAIAIKE